VDIGVGAGVVTGLTAGNCAGACSNWGVDVGFQVGVFKLGCCVKFLVPSLKWSEPPHQVKVNTLRGWSCVNINCNDIADEKFSDFWCQLCLYCSSWAMLYNS
jgi:hypothetical protein